MLEAARAAGASHFVLLSAICVQKPLLEFQHAKLKFEAALQAAGDITYSIVRPTAFFKSLAGQVWALARARSALHLHRSWTVRKSASEEAALLKMLESRLLHSLIQPC